MKRLFLIIFSMWITISTFAQISQVIDVTNEDIEIACIDNYTQVSYGHFYNHKDVGYPQIPIVYKQYAIPIDASNVSLRISSCEMDTLLSDVYLYPVQYPQPSNSSNMSDFTEPNDEFYQQVTLYPNIVAEIVSDTQMMGFRIVKVACYPFAYIPKEGVLYKRRVDYTLDYSSTSEILFDAPKISDRRARSAQEYIASIVENRGEVLNTNISPVVNQKMSATDLSVQNDVIPDYVIITNNELKSEFQRLADWKTKKGVPTIIKTIEEIETEFVGADLVDKIKGFLVNVENKWGNECMYLLLGGDSDIIPCREVESWVSKEKGKLYATDACYVDSDFTINWPDLTAESDICRNIFMGRLPINTSNQARKFIHKLIHYEKADFNIDYSYMNNFLMTCALMYDSNKYPYAYNSDRIRNHLDNYREQYLPVHFNYWYLYDHVNCSCPSTTHPQFIADTVYTKELNKKNFMSALNGETEFGFPHIIHVNDHGHPWSIGASSKDKCENLYNNDIYQIRDTTHLNIAFTICCNTANFPEDCIGENLLRKNTVAYLGNTDSGYILEYGFLEEYLKLLFNQNIYHVGKLHAKILPSLWDNPHRFHLLGDPEMPIWTNIPQNLDVTVSPTNRIVASWQEPTTIKVKVNNLPTGETATVCIMKDTEVYKVMEIADTLEHKYQCTPLTEGTMHVTVTAHNFRPHETAIPVVANAPTLSIENVEFLSGNDGIISPGEDVQLRVTLKNSGVAAISSVEATMGTASPYITFARNQLSCGEIESGATRTFTNTFRFNVATNAPEILRNDFNGTTFHLRMVKDDLEPDVDTFRVDLIPPKYKFVSHKRTGPATLTAGSSHIFISEIANLGKIEANPRMEIIPETAGVDTIIYAGSGRWRVTIADNYQIGTPVKLRVNLYGNNILSDSHVIEMQDEKLAVTASSIGVHEDEKSVTLYWTIPSNAYGYHVYRSMTPTSGYTRLNKMPLTGGFFIDENLEANTTYYYKVSAVNQSFVEGNLSSLIKTHTLCGTMEGFPIIARTELHEYRGEATTVDLDYDGQQEIILTAYYENLQKGKVIVVNPDATEPFDTDNDAASITGYADIPWPAMATPTVADIYGTGIPCIIASTRNGTKANYIICYSSEDGNGDGRPDSLWQTAVPGSYFRSPVVTDINPQDGKGEKEIITIGDSPKSVITILDCNGNILHSLGNPEDMVNYSVCTPAVADLDGDEYKEIVLGNRLNLYVWSYNGTVWSQRILFTADGRPMESSPVICDFDNDGEKEIIVATPRRNPSHIYVFKQDGTCLSGFDGTTGSASIPYSNATDAGLDHGVAVGDIDNDGFLEIVALGTDSIYAWNHDGTFCFKQHFSGLFPNREETANVVTPILADVSGDSIPEVVFHLNNKIHALNSEGIEITGFPLKTFDFIRNGICVSDIDGDMKNEIVAADNVGKIFVWKTNGHPAGIEWGRFRKNTENTSEYVSGYKDPWVITSNTTWAGGTFTNDIIVRSGTFTIPQGVTLDMRKPYRIYVMNGGTLNLTGGSITNADILVKSGGTLNVSGNSQIILRSTGGNLNVDKGAVMNIPLGTVR